MRKLPIIRIINSVDDVLTDPFKFPRVGTSDLYTVFLLPQFDKRMLIGYYKMKSEVTKLLTSIHDH